MTVAARGERRCQWCGASLLATGDKWCSKRCRQTAWRFRQVASVSLGPGQRRLAYADPPYPGCARKYYADEASYGGEVDHADLVRRLQLYDGWALSTSRRALRDVLSLTPGNAIVCPWVKTHKEPRALGPANIHEYLIVVPGRWRQPGPPDAFVGSVARGGDSDLMGRKPLKFIAWMFQLLGATPGDTLDDLYPGSGVVGRCWDEFSRQSVVLDPGDAAAVAGAGG